MPLTLVTDLGDAAANAYTDLASVRAVAAYRGAAGAAFNLLTDDQASSAIATMSADIDSSDWDGEKADDAQAMAWPRTGTLHSGTGAPPEVVRATIEGSIAIGARFAPGYTADPLNPPADRLKRDKTGPLEVEFFQAPTVAATSADRLPPIVQRLIARYLRRENASAWGRGTVVRGS